MNFIMKHKGKILFIGVIFLILISSFFFGGGDFEPAEVPSSGISECVTPSSSPELPVPTAKVAKDTSTPLPAKAPDTTKAPEVPTPAPTPTPTPTPVPTPESDAALYCTLSVRCDAIFDNLSALAPEKLQVIPENGVIFPEQQVVFYEGESVFNLLTREMKKNKIHLEFVETPAYDSMYIEGIGNLYQFDCGELSGWLYRVNGKTPSVGCSLYELKSGDRVEFLYTCDLGNDL